MSDDREVVLTRWSASDDALDFTVTEPATGRPLATVRGAGPAEVDGAVRAASTAQRSWARRPAAERGAVLQEVSRALASCADELAKLESAEMGKPVSQARDFDVRMMVGLFDYFGGILPALTGSVRDTGALMDVTEHHPFGVVAGIIPFNWPPIHTAGKAAPALAMGNAMVLKPGEQAPLTVMRAVEVIAGVLPDDVLHVVPGDGAVGGALVSHPLVKKVSFTGAPGTGAKVAGAAADNLVPTVLELGGKNAIVVLPDADLDAAARAIVEGAFFNQGEACTASSRALLHRDVHDEVVERVAAATARLVVGHGARAGTHVGPLVTRQQQQRVLDYIELGEREGARLVSQAPLPTDPDLAEGFYVRPSVFVDVEPDMRIAQEEIFGPVLSVLTFDDDAEAVEIANGTAFGLVAGVYTRDYERGVRLGRQLDAGIVFVNNYHRAVLGIPFGGTKHSGYGREHALETLREWAHTKTLRLPFGGAPVPEWDALGEVFGRDGRPD